MAALDEDDDSSCSEYFVGEVMAEESETLLQEDEDWEVIEAEESAMGFADQVASGPDELPGDLVMGCLDPACNTVFRDKRSQQHKCGCCRSVFCCFHTSDVWPITNTRPRSNSFIGDDQTASFGSDSSAEVLECLGLSPGFMSYRLCHQCKAMLSLEPPLPLPSLPSRSASAASPPQSPRSVPKAPITTVSLAALLQEAQVLLGLPYEKLQESPADEDRARRVGRPLLQRQLVRLRDCLRKWTDTEKEWVFRRLGGGLMAVPGWPPQLLRQTDWSNKGEAQAVSKQLQAVCREKLLTGRDAVQVLSVLGRHASSAASSLNDIHLGQMVAMVAEALEDVKPQEMACFLELLLDASCELGLANATRGRTAVLQALFQAAAGPSPEASALRGELCWALEARSVHARGGCVQVAWAAETLEELLHRLSAEDQLAWHRQFSWVRRIEAKEWPACRAEPCWGERRAFPLAIWSPSRKCLGLLGSPEEMPSKSRPVKVVCASSVVRKSSGSRGGSATSTATVTQGSQTAGLFLKRDADMQREQQLGQTLRLLELLIWEDAELLTMLESKGLTLDDVRATYIIAMTGPESAMIELVHAKTLRFIRDVGGLQIWFRQHNSSKEEQRALTRLAFTSAISAVLSFVAGLGDRHHENIMVTTTGRLLHVDYGYALGREPLDSMLFYHLVDGGRPATTLHYQELHDALGPKLLDMVFWPVIRIAYRRIHEHAGLLAEMVHVAAVRDPRVRGDHRGDALLAWENAQVFVSRNCVPTMSPASSERFIDALLRHCAHHERGVQFRDKFKNMKVRAKQAVSGAVHRFARDSFEWARSSGAVLETAAPSLIEATAGVVTDFFDGVRAFI